MSKKNILTGAVVALALVLAVIAILVKTGVFSSAPETTKEVETVIETSVEVVSQTQEDGSIVYMTMVHEYARPKVSSHHVYPTTKRVTNPEDTVKYIEQTSFVHMTDENGIPLFDDNGNPVTEVVSYTIREDSTTTTEPTTEFIPRTSSVVVTNRFGKPQKDENGNPVTEVVTLDAPPTTEKNIWATTEEGTTGKFNIDIQTDLTRDDTLAQNIVDQINADRKKAGLDPLEHSTDLKSAARGNSAAMANPDVFGEPSAQGAYTLTTPYGGNPVYQTVAAANKDRIMSEETTKIGVGVVKYEGKYYTTVIFG